MAGVDTNEIMQIALKLAGFSKVPEDSGIHVPGDNLQKILFSMDINVGLIFMAHQMGFDAVIGHHPCGVLFKRGEVYRRHIDLLQRLGISREKITHALGEIVDSKVRRIENQRFRMLYNESPNQTVLEVDAAKFLGLPLMNIHNPLDEIGRKLLQAKLDEVALKNPRWKLFQVLEVIANLPEAHCSKTFYGISPQIFIGDPETEASKVAFVHGALTAPSAEIVRFYWQNRIKTVITLHAESETLEILKKGNQGNLICTGHFLGDSIGATPFIKALRQKGLKVFCMGGIIDVETLPC